MLYFLNYTTKQEIPLFLIPKLALMSFAIWSFFTQKSMRVKRQSISHVRPPHPYLPLYVISNIFIFIFVILKWMQQISLNTLIIIGFAETYFYTFSYFLLILLVQIFSVTDNFQNTLPTCYAIEGRNNTQYEKKVALSKLPILQISYNFLHELFTSFCNPAIITKNSCIPLT